MFHRLTLWVLVLVLVLVFVLVGCSQDNEGEYEEQQYSAGIAKAVCVNTRTLSGFRALADYGDGRPVDEYFPVGLDQRCNDDLIATVLSQGVSVMRKGNVLTRVDVGKRTVWVLKP